MCRWTVSLIPNGSAMARLLLLLRSSENEGERSGVRPARAFPSSPALMLITERVVACG
jgi:hypothetical protein